MGRSSWQDEALSRWGGDRVEDADGWRLWLRDPDLGRLWALRPPAGAHGGLRIGPGGFGWTQRDHGIETRVEVCVSARDAELRTVHVRNRSDRPRALEITGCLELVLHDPSADAAHPAFSKLFVQTAWDPAAQALVASRRPRSPEEQHVRVAHALVGEGRLEWETDRARFLGRGRSAAPPAALCTRRPLSGSVGSVLDPVFAARRTLVLGPGEERRWTFVLAAARSRAAALGAARSLATETAIDAEFGAARGAAQATLDRFGLSAEDAELLPPLTGALLYGAPRLRAGARGRWRAPRRPGGAGAVRPARRPQGVGGHGPRARLLPLPRDRRDAGGRGRGTVGGAHRTRAHRGGTSPAERAARARGGRR